VCFDKDGKTIYVTRNNFKKCKVVRSSTGDVKLNLYRAEYDTNKKRFVNLQGFDFNSDEYNTAHPAISPDGTKLYFASDMPGGQGGMDIWVTTKTGTGWSKPENLGSKVNSAGDEVFPYVLDKKTLYFSSNGLDGIGGLDIFSVKLNDNGMPVDAPKNLGIPINSPADDFGIVFYGDGKRGYFSSNRENFDLDDNIYEFTCNKPDKLPYTILVLDSVTRKQLESNIVITQSETGERKELTEKNGQFITDLHPETVYSISADANEYKPKANITFKTPVDNSKHFEILLAPVDKYFIAGTVYEVFDDSTKKSLDSAIVIIKDETGNVVCTSYLTDAGGKYHSCDLKANTQYTVMAMKDGYFAKSSVVTFIPPGGAIRNFYLSKIVVGKAIKIENIYFDLDKSNIRPDAAVELDKIVKLMQENPEIIIELGSHTDCRAPAAYNMALSDRRAKASAAYIVSKGIDSKRITGRGYGESQLVNRCACEGNVKSDCTEEEHQQNRRTEFKVTGFVKGMGNVDVKSGH
jgi:outer membrane protein OmpA-like peptidoglycan-associated protein